MMASNASEFFENLGKSLSKTADKVAKRTDEFISVQKIKNRKNTLENSVNSTYRTIGKLIYSQQSEGGAFTEDVVELCRKIDALTEEIHSCSEQLSDLKGMRQCPECGQPVPNEADFCMKCGAKMPERKADEEDSAEEAEFEEVDEFTDEENAAEKDGE